MEKTARGRNSRFTARLSETDQSLTVWSRTKNILEYWTSKKPFPFHSSIKGTMTMLFLTPAYENPDLK